MSRARRGIRKSVSCARCSIGRCVVCCVVCRRDRVCGLSGSSRSMLRNGSRSFSDTAGDVGCRFAAASAACPTEDLMRAAVSRPTLTASSAPSPTPRKIDLRPPPPKRDVLLPPMNIQSTPMPIKAAEIGFSRTASWSELTKSPPPRPCAAAAPSEPRCSFV